MDVIGALGLPTRTFTDAYGQIQQSLGPGLSPTASPRISRWAGRRPIRERHEWRRNLDVGEAQFTYDFGAANSFVIARSQDSGKRSALGFTAEGFFGGTPQPIRSRAW